MSEKRTVIGLDMVHVAKVLTDDSSGITFDTPIPITGAVKMTINPNGSNVEDYGDNAVLLTINSRASTQVSCEFMEINDARKAELLGQTRANGITAETAMDQSPYFAIGGRRWLSGTDDSGNKVYEYIWLLKGKFAVPNIDSETKKDNVSPQHVTLEGSFISPTYVSNILTRGRTDEGLSSAAASAWFDAPVISPTVDLGALGVVIAKSSTNTTFTFAKTGGGAFSIVEASAVIGESILVSKAGVLQTGAIVWTGQGTATVVGTFTPDTAYGTADIDFVVTSGVKDTNGVSCTPEVLQISYP